MSRVVSTSISTPSMTSSKTDGGLSVVRPDATEWDDGRRAWNLAVDQRPGAIVVPDSVRAVVDGVGWARESGVRVAVQATGHGAAPMGPLDDTRLLRTERMRGVEIDVDAGVARVQAGALWGQVIEAASRHGLAPLSGASADVGAVGCP